MSFTFSDLVEEIRLRPAEQKAEIKEIIEHDLIHSERERMYQNHLDSMREWEEERIVSASSVDDLIRRLEAE